MYSAYHTIVLEADGTCIEVVSATLTPNARWYAFLFVFVEPKAGKRHVLVTARRTKMHFAYAMRYLVDHLYPDAVCIDVVMDNLNTQHL